MLSRGISQIWVKICTVTQEFLAMRCINYAHKTAKLLESNSFPFSAAAGAPGLRLMGNIFGLSLTLNLKALASRAGQAPVTFGIAGPAQNNSQAQHSSSICRPHGSQVQQECGNVVVCPVGSLIPPEIQEALFRAQLCSFSHADPGLGTVPENSSINKEPSNPRIREVGKHLQDH